LTPRSNRRDAKKKVGEEIPNFSLFLYQRMNNENHARGLLKRKITEFNQKGKKDSEPEDSLFESCSKVSSSGTFRKTA